MAEQSLIKPYSNILDPHPTGDKAIQVVETILPYFPEHPLKRRYLAYISSGYTRKESIKRCRMRADEFAIDQDTIDIDVWRAEDPQFSALDDLGYGELRNHVANAYMELMVRRDTVAVLELNELVIASIEAKLRLGVELTKDEKFIYGKAANIYTPENIGKMVKLVSGNLDDETKPSGMIIDFVAMVKGQIKT